MLVVMLNTLKLVANCTRPNRSFAHILQHNSTKVCLPEVLLLNLENLIFFQVCLNNTAHVQL